MKYFMTALLLIAMSMNPISAKLKSTGKSEKRTITGYLVDMNCASAFMKGAPNKIEQKAKAHTLACNLDDMCAAAGYAVISNGVLYTLDGAGNTLALKYCKSISKKDNIKVEVVGTVGNNNVLAVEDIHDAADKRGKK